MMKCTLIHTCIAIAALAAPFGLVHAQHISSTRALNSAETLSLSEVSQTFVNASLLTPFVQNEGQMSSNEIDFAVVISGATYSFG